MSEITLEAELLLDDRDRQAELLQSLSASDSFFVEEFLQQDEYMRVLLLGNPVDFEPSEALTHIRKARPGVLLVEVFDNQTGESARQAWKGGQKCARKTARKALTEKVPLLAALAAIEANSFPRIEKALERVADINAHADGQTLLFAACYNQASAKIITELLVRGADPNVANRDGAADGKGRSPLAQAVDNEKTIVVNKLLEAGARVDVTDARGFTPFLDSVEIGRSARLIEMLIKAGSDVNHECNEGGNAAWYATRSPARKVLQQFQMTPKRPKNAYPYDSASQNLEIALWHRDEDKIAELLKEIPKADFSSVCSHFLSYDNFEPDIADKLLRHCDYLDLATTHSNCETVIAVSGPADSKFARKIISLIERECPEAITRLRAEKEKLVSDLRQIAKVATDLNLEAPEGRDEFARLYANTPMAPLLQQGLHFFGMPKYLQAIRLIADGAELIGGLHSDGSAELYVADGDWGKILLAQGPDGWAPTKLSFH